MSRYRIALFICLLQSVQVWPQNPAPVYVNPAAKAVVLPESQSTAGSLLTQTVYGFLDFTTTIGNTVMVFSPQSAPAAGNKEPKPEVNVIETKPKTESVTPDIKPSKATPEPQPETSTSVNIETEQKPAVASSSVEIRVEEEEKAPVFSSVVEVKEEQKAPVFSSVVEVKEEQKAPVFVVEVKEEPKAPVFSSVVEVKEDPRPVPEVKPPVVSSRVEVEEEPQKKPEVSSVVEVRAVEDDIPVVSGNNIVGKEFYDFLSKEPAEVVDETFKVFDIKPSTKVNVRVKTRQSVEVRTKVNVVTQTDIKTRVSTSQHGGSSKSNAFPTGLVTTMGGTIVKDGLTTVHETQVIGTFISGKYAQILQSTSHIYHGKPSPTPTLRILKTAAPLPGNRVKTHLDPTPAGSLLEETVALPLEVLFSSVQELGPSATSRFSFSSLHEDRRDELLSSAPRVRSTSTRRSPLRTDFLSRLQRNRLPSSKDDDKEESEDEVRKPSSRVRASQSLRPSFRFSGGSRWGRTTSSFPSTSELSTVSVYSDSKGPSRRFQSYRSRTNFRPNTTPGIDSTYTRRGYKPRHSSTESSQSSTSLYKFKLARPTGRWQYKTSPKPRVSIRRQSEDAPEESLDQDSNGTAQQPEEQLQSDEPRQEESVTILPDDDETQDLQPAQAETIGIEISTPADFPDVYYEIATIKSPYTFQVGTVKNTRFITVTSTMSRTFEPSPTQETSTSTEPLTENILASTEHYDNLLQASSSIATLPPIGLAGDAETPPLETFTETFSTTSLMLKTHILPVFKGSDTTHYTLVQSYHITRLVTAIKTLPPMEVYQFIPSRTLKEFNTRLEEAGSENREHLLESELEFGENDNDEDVPAGQQRVFPPDLDLANVGSDFDVADVDKRIGPQILAKAQPAPVVTPAPPPAETTPQLSPEQLQHLALLRYLNPVAPLPFPGVHGAQNVVTTSRPVIRMETLYESHVIPIWNGLTTTYSTLTRPVGTVSKTEYEYGTTQVAPANPFQQFTLTSAPVVTSTMVTSTNSKILRLTFGAKTAFTTLFSTTVVPTVVTTYITTSVPVQPTAAFPGYYPGGFPPFPPYVG